MNGRLTRDKEELESKVAATSADLTEASAANQQLQDQLATALQAGMDLVQQLAEARSVQPRRAASVTPPAKPAFGLLGYATNSMQSPWEAELHWGKPTPTCMSSLSKAYRWDKTSAGVDGQDQYALHGRSPLPPVLGLTWTPSKFSSPTPSGTFTPSGAHGVMPETEAMPGVVSNLSSPSSVSPLSHASVSCTTTEKLSSPPQEQVEGAQLATTPPSQLLVRQFPTDTQSFMRTPFPGGVQAMLIGMPSATSTAGPSSRLTSAQARQQGLSWGTTLAESGGSAYIAPDATSPLPSMQTPTPVNIEAMLMNVPSSTPARAPRLTLTVQAKNQALTWIKSKADFGGQDYFAGDANSPLPSMLGSSWSPSNFLGPTPPGAATTHDALPVMEAAPGMLTASKQVPTPVAPTTHGLTEAGELLHKQDVQLAGSPPSKLQADFLPAIAVMGSPPPPVGAEAVLKDASSSTPMPAPLSGLTLAAQAQNQAMASARVSAVKARTPLSNVTNVLDSQVTSGRKSVTPTRFSLKKGLSSLFKAAVPSPLKPAQAFASPLQPAQALSSPNPYLRQSQTQTPMSRESPSSASPGTPPNADLMSPAPSLLRRSAAAVAVQPSQGDMLLCPTLVCSTHTLAASASHAAQTEVASQASQQPPVVVTAPPRPHAELPSTSSSTSSSRRCSKGSSLTSPVTRSAFQSAASPLSRPWSIAGPNSPAASASSMGAASAVKPGRAAGARSTSAQQSPRGSGVTTRVQASGRAGMTSHCTTAVRAASQATPAASIGVTTRAQAAGQAGVTPSSTKAVRPANQAATAASTARTGAPGRARSSTIAEASRRAGQHAKQAATQAGNDHFTGKINGSNSRSDRRQASLTAGANGVKQSAPTKAKQSAATGVKQSASIKPKSASVTTGAANRPASGRTAAGRRTALKAEVPTRVPLARAARKGWR